MKIGYPTHPRKNLIEEIVWIGKNKFDFVDLFLEEDCATPEKINIKEIKNVLGEYKLGAVGHLAWYLPIGSPIEKLRKAAVSEAVRYFELFNKLGVKFVTIHSDWPNRLFSSKEGCDFQIKSLTDLIKESSKYGLSLVYEPIDTQNDTVENLSFILKKIPKLFLHLDVGHANLYGRNPNEFIEKFHEKLKRVHLHDNFGSADLHLPIGVGVINWEKIIQKLKKYYDGTITLEIFSRDKDYVLLSKEKLRKLWDEL